MTLKQETLDDIINRVVQAIQPDRIILFGSAARGDMGRDSDVDLLVVKGGENSWAVMGRIYESLYGVDAAVDAVVVSPEEVERYKDAHALVIKPALQEGRVVYESSRTLPSG